MTKFIKYLDKKGKRNLLLLIVFVLINVIVSFVPIKIMENLVNQAVSDENILITILVLGGAYLFLQILFAGMASLLNYFIEKFQIMLSAKIQKETYKKLLRVNLQYLLEKESMDVMNSLVNDVDVIAEKSIYPLTRSIGALCAFSIGVVYIVSINWILAIIIIPLGLITAILNRTTKNKFMKNAKKRKQTSLSLWKSFSENFKGIVPIRIYRREKYFEFIVSDKINLLSDISYRQSRLEKWNYFIASGLFMLSIGVILTVSAVMVSQGMMLIGGMVAILMYNHMLTDPLINILESRHVIAELNVSFNRIESILQEEDDHNISMKRTSINSLKLKDVSFSYKKTDEMVLSNINLTIEQGEKIAIIGETGSGKSTVAKLISGLYKPTFGEVKFYQNNTEINGLPIISYLSQNAYLFDDTIINNIKFSNPDITNDYLDLLIKKCKISDIMKIHENSIGENGSMLSGGEKARLRIAMTLAKNDASLYIFDEMSSSLDDYTALDIFNNVNELLDEKMCVFVEHNNDIKYIVNKLYKMEKGTLKLVS